MWPTELSGRLGDQATLVQFSSSFCAPCRTTRQLLTDVVGKVEGVAHIDIDAESRLDLVRRVGVRRTPTVLVLDAAGTEVSRTTGAPTRAAVYVAIDQAISARLS